MTRVGRAVWRLLLRLIIGGGVALILYLFGPTIWRLFSPFLLAIPVAIMLQKPIRFTEKRLRMKHGAAVAVWVILVCVVICGLLYWLASTVVGQILQLSGNSQSVIGDIINQLRGTANQIFDALDYLPASVDEWARAALNDGLAELSATGTRLLSAIFNFTINFASGIPYGLLYLNFLLLGIYFISAGYSSLRERAYSRMGDSMRSRSELLSGSAGSGMAAYINVQLFYGLIVLVVSIPALSLFGIPYAVLIALLAALLEFLPIFGNGTLYIPWAIICYIIGNPLLGTEMLALHLALFIFRRITEPKLLAGRMGLSTLLSLVAMFVGMQLSGVMGLILAPVAVVVIQAAWVGGIFTSTMDDIHCVFEHVRCLLAEPEPEPQEPPKPPYKKA